MWNTPLDAPQCPADGAAVQHVAGDVLDVEVGDVVELGPVTDRDAHVVPALDEQPRDVRPDQTRGPGDEDRWHARSVSAMCRVPPGHMPVAVVTDTTHYLPADFVAEYGIHLVSLYVRWGDELERESEMPDFDAFYERLRTAPELPTTSQPSIGDFLAVYEPLLETGDDIVSIHLSAGISGTYDGALQAKAQLEEQGHSGRIEVVDSATAAGGMGLVARRGGRGGALGRRAERRRRPARDAAREQLKIWFAVDTLEYLRRGGRIGAAQAWLGGALKIKPILSLEHEITPVERVRTSGKAFERHGRVHARRGHDDGADALGRPAHPGRPTWPSASSTPAARSSARDPFFVSEVGPVIGAHAGPGLVGVGGIPLSLVR